MQRSLWFHWPVWRTWGEVEIVSNSLFPLDSRNCLWMIFMSIDLFADFGTMVLLDFWHCLWIIILSIDLHVDFGNCFSCGLHLIWRDTIFDVVFLNFRHAIPYSREIPVSSLAAILAYGGRIWWVIDEFGERMKMKVVRKKGPMSMRGERSRTWPYRKHESCRCRRSEKWNRKS